MIEVGPVQSSEINQTKFVNQPHQRQCVLPAIIQQSLPGSLMLVSIQAASYERLPCQPRILPTATTLQLASPEGIRMPVRFGKFVKDEGEDQLLVVPIVDGP